MPLNPIAGTSPAYIKPYNASNRFDYAPKHNPQVYFTDTNGGNNATPSNPLSQHYAPLQQLLTDLSNNTVSKYNWITPDQFNDSHSALAGGFTYNGVHYTGDQASIAQGDHFLSIIVPQIEASHVGSCGANDLSDLFKPGAIPSAVPEPPTWAMMLLGFAGLGFAAHRQARKAVC